MKTGGKKRWSGNRESEQEWRDKEGKLSKFPELDVFIAKGTEVRQITF